MSDRSPEPGESLPLSFVRRIEAGLRIDAACQPFEDAWQAVRDGGPRPRIEDYLKGVAEAERWPLLRELLQVELHHRRGERPSPDEYRARFAEFGPLLQQFFDELSSAAGDTAEPV